MLNHVMVGSQDIERAKRFYDAVLGVLGAPEGMRNTGPGGHQRVFWRHEGNTFAITEPINGEAPSVSNGATIGFKCTSPEQLIQFHDVAVAHGGTSIEDAPGPRGEGHGGMHLAYVRDPDGHKLCALYRPGRKA